MKILVVSGYNPFIFGSGPGGCLYYLSKTLAGMGCEIHILSPKSDRAQDVGKGVFMHYYDGPFKRGNLGQSWLVFSLFSVNQINRLCKEYGIEIVNGHSPTTFSYAVIRDTKLPFIVSSHGTSFGEMYSIYNTPRQYLDRASIRDVSMIQPLWGSLTSLEYKYADRIVAVSNSVADELVNYYHLDRQKISTIHNGVVSIQVNEPLEENLILAAGRMVWRKGFSYLINAMPSILEEFPTAKLMLVGEGTYKEKLIKQVKKLNLQRSVVFKGLVSKNELFHLYAKANVYVQPSLYEPLGNTILEAMSAQKAVVASRIGGIPELIRHRVNGLLVDPSSSSQLAESINQVLSDQTYCKQLGRNAKETMAAQFSWESIAKKTLTLFKESVNSH